MAGYVAVITESGDVKLPPEVSLALGVKSGDTIVFRVEANLVQVEPVERTLEQVFGSVRAIQHPEDFAERSRSAKAEKVERTIRELEQR
jgi:bifunctional DNA-binding transcriptional regulator/antitoxin component of YhaV-PrlF toxin-antitoxin module